IAPLTKPRSRANPKSPGTVDVSYVDNIGGKTVGDRVSGCQTVVDPVKPLACSDPKVALAIFGHRENKIIRKTVFDCEEPEFGISKPVQPAIGADPQIPLPVLENRQRRIGSESFADAVAGK